jgi:3-mercaptopyruvate sulfurtransferase SseA
LAAFLLRMLGNHRVSVYDASMAEWANRDDTPLV